MTKFNNTTLTVLAFIAGKNYSEAHNVKGNKFLGGFNVADAIGFDRDTPEWNAAVTGAMAHIQDIPKVIVDTNGTLIQ